MCKIILYTFAVAPARGAWIEIFSPTPKAVISMVAPARGAWIEILWLAVFDIISCVAPARGAWIEIESGKQDEAG